MTERQPRKHQITEDLTRKQGFRADARRAWVEAFLAGADAATLLAVNQAYIDSMDGVDRAIIDRVTAIVHNMLMDLEDAVVDLEVRIAALEAGGVP